MPNKLTLDDETLWRTWESRDTSMVGRFVIAVASTGVYCRPGCPARMPKRKNVRFFADCDEAEAAGFRACKRCKPRERFEDGSALVEKACEMLAESADERPGLAAVSRQLGVSTGRLQRMFRQTLGVTPGEYAAARRVERLKDGLRNGNDVTGALYDAGYGSSSRLYESAGTTLGMTPAAYRRRGSGMSIRYTIVDSHLGRLLVGATERGVCSVKMGDRDGDLEAILHKEYPAAQIERVNVAELGQLSRWVEALVEHIATGKPSLDLPLDIRVTAFQGRVYQALRAIANGQTRSYGEVAKEIGRPKAVRAVANACADNPVALTVPCHRVIRGNGELGGYGGGVHRKRELLAREARAALRESQGDASRTSARTALTAG
ncbi:MAG: bifunctional DNA-binding transcriptional regulator/O6-methylguanine-DNA methyltransferase Ada [Chloroflexi bacterium]|nr:MAG: bifunctional DNA-binding transcriptional regulator/O6-methylguanine-DNA methyltransferase Ada [Chloroflexota bacterium]